MKSSEEFKILLESLQNNTYKGTEVAWNANEHGAQLYGDIVRLVECVISSKGIKSLTLISCGLTDELVDLVIKDNCITHLNVSSNCLSDEALKSIGDNSALEVLVMYDNSWLTDEVCTKYISANSALKMICFGDNRNLTVNAAKALCHHPTLEKIVLNANVLTIEEMRADLAGDVDIDTC